jgi:hypothetical protein
LVSLAQPDSKSFDELVGILSKHFQPTTSEISERYSFHCRCQEAGENIADYVANLRKLIFGCNYPVEFQSTILRDRFVCGLTHESTRKRLLTENNDLTFEKAVDIAVGVEKACLHARQMKPDNKSSTLHHLPNNQQRNRSGHGTHTHQSFSPTCHRCGGPHLATACRFINEKCRSCGKMGHIAKVCRSSKPSSSVHRSGQTSTGHRAKTSNRTHMLEVDPLTVNTETHTPDSGSPPTVYSMFYISSRSEPIMLSVRINNCPLNMELDTGAAVTVISENTFNSIFKDTIYLQPSHIALRTYLDTEVPILGTAEVKVQYESQTATLPLVVVKGQGAKFIWSQLVNKYSMSFKEVKQG